MDFNRIVYKSMAALALAALMSACKVAAPAPLPATPTLPAFGAGTDSTSLSDLTWREFFKDPALIALIDTALYRNPDMLAAAQQIEIARANVQMAQGALLPQVSGVGAVGAERFGKYTMTGVGNYDTNLSPNVTDDQKVSDPLVPDYFLGLRSSWEIDLWGKLRKSKKAAMARFLASEKGRQLVVTSLIADVAHLYYHLLALDVELETLNRNIELQQIGVELIKVQKEGGRATELAVQQFMAQLLNTKGLKVEKEQEIVGVENQLNRLLGRFPQPIARGRSLYEQELPEEARAGVASEMLRRRPDIRMAELELVAAKVDVEAARAAFLPSLTISPYVGFSAFNASLLFQPASLAYGLLSGLSAPLLNRNHLQAAYRSSDANRFRAFSAYQSTVLTGVQEVMTSLNEIENYRKVAALKEEEVNVLQNAVETSNDLFAVGYATYLEIIMAQRSVLEAELNLTNTRESILQSTVRLYRALGGGWQE
ncbi:efflux transporter outer membrane subunit [Pontibacter qinzhouensis]|uniref:Efflux transporter outer membrane subunit n=1 Tax=Pontibacter qinzhouensis TaxID=2603253 RepID=A0A5C8J758_9BACT|nr:efflux transporter outer membrane subunit [Pontibacter qinzhouensis]TXK33765.1 efflux transporter outer membrane subunit [Pontibacter qinzhouensis]